MNVSTTYAYNAMNQLTGLVNNSTTNTILSQFGHNSDPTKMLLRDAAGNLKREIAVFGTNANYSGTTNYTYDNKNQLLNESSTRNAGFNNAFGYDAMGNPTSWKGQARTFNLNNQETTGGVTQFSYDGNGNPTTYKGSTFAFNENDKLTQITTAGTVRLQASYRSDGLRGWKSTSNGTTYFLYDGDQLVCEFDGNVNLKNINVWGANGLYARQTRQSGFAPSTPITAYLWDDRGNLSTVLPNELNPNGTGAANYNVSAWGDIRSDAAIVDVYSGLGGQFGNYLDRETGLTLCGQRYYDASAGRWLNRDPIDYEGGLNVYGYVTNNPVNKIDPLGLASLIEVPAVGGLSYSHVYIRFDQRPMKNPIFGYGRDKRGIEHDVAWTAGFYPTSGGFLGFGSPGDIQAPDLTHDASRDGCVRRRIDSWKFEEALAKVIALSEKKKPKWGAGYLCSNWARDMWKQAKILADIQSVDPAASKYVKEYGIEVDMDAVRSLYTFHTIPSR